MDLRDLKKEAVIINEDLNFQDALELMMSKKTNEVFVVNGEGKLTGEITVADLLNAIVPEYSDPDNILENLSTEDGFKAAVADAKGKLVSDFMTVNVQPVQMEDSLLTIASTALANQTEHIPIVDNEHHPIGVISRRGIKHILAKYLGLKTTK